MLITENRLRNLVREILLAEVITNKHGYAVRSESDVKWSKDKASIPGERNPFLGSSKAFESWFDDGEIVKTFAILKNKGTDAEEPALMFSDANIKEGDLVIIPELWSSLPVVGLVIVKRYLSAQEAGIPGASKTASIPLADIKFEKQGDMPPFQMMGVGLAFLRKVGSSRLLRLPDARQAAKEYMAERSAESGSESQTSDEPVGARGVIRRRAGEAPAPRPAAPKGPVTLTAADREMLLGRNRE